MRYIIIILLLLAATTGISQERQRIAVADTSIKNLSRADKVGRYFNLEKAKTDKLNYIDKELEEEYAKIPLQFKDSMGRKLAYARLEQKRDLRYEQVLGKERLKAYKVNNTQRIH